MPANVVWFERLAYASLALGLLDLALDFQNLSRLSPAVNLIGTLVLTMGVIALLIWLVARRRQGWARWAFLILFLFGLPFLFMNLLQQSLLTVPISLLQVVLQGVALFFVFTGDAAPWFVQARAVPLPKVPMPMAVERFEQLGYVGLILAIVATAFDLLDVTRVPRESVAGKAVAVLAGFAVIGIGWLLIWLIARRRQGWARWVFLAFSLLVLAFLVLRFGTTAFWLDGLRGLQVLAWLAAISFTLTDEARPWFRPTSLPDVGDKPKMRVRVAAGQRIVVEPDAATHRSKVDSHIAEVGALGIPAYVAAPPPFELLWAMGLEIPPPLFLGFLPTMLIAGIPFAIVWTLPSALMARPTIALVLAAWGGLIFGAIVAAYYRHKSRDLALPAWEDYLPILRA